MSPTTNSLLATSKTPPFLLTLTRVSSLLVKSKSNFLEADQVFQNLIPTAIAIAAIIPIGSEYSDFKIPITKETHAATSNIIIRGSLKPSNNIIYQGSLLGGVSTL